MDKQRSAKRRRKSGRLYSDAKFASLGDGVVGYIRTMTSEEARERYPGIDDLPRGITLYALHAADGTPIALTDTRQAAMTHAIGDDLELATVH